MAAHLATTTAWLATGAACMVLAIQLLLGDPLPAPTVGTTVFGIVAFWSSRRRFVVLTLAGAVFGAAAGTGVHAASHLAEHRLQVTGGLARHLVGDGLVGLGLGLVTLLPLFLVLCAAAPEKAP